MPNIIYEKNYCRLNTSSSEFVLILCFNAVYWPNGMFSWSMFLKLLVHYTTVNILRIIVFTVNFIFNENESSIYHASSSETTVGFIWNKLAADLEVVIPSSWSRSVILVTCTPEEESEIIPSLAYRDSFGFSLTKGQCSKRYTMLSVLAVHRPFYISICSFPVVVRY